MNIRDYFGDYDESILLDAVINRKKDVLMTLASEEGVEGYESMSLEQLLLIAIDIMYEARMIGYIRPSTICNFFIESDRFYFLYENNCWRFDIPVNTVDIFGEYDRADVLDLSIVGRGLFGMPKNTEALFNAEIDIRSGLLYIPEENTFYQGILCDGNEKSLVKRALLLS